MASSARLTAGLGLPPTRGLATIEDFQMARSLGVTGFPTVVVNDDEGYAYLTVGYQPYEHLERLLDRPLERVFEQERGGDIRHSLADNGRLLAAFGDAEFVGVEAGLETYLESLATSLRASS